MNKQNEVPFEKQDSPILDAEIEKIVAASKVKLLEENPNSTQHRFPEALTKIFKTLGLHSPKGIKMPNSAKLRKQSNTKNKRARQARGR